MKRHSWLVIAVIAIVTDGCKAEPRMARPPRTETAVAIAAPDTAPSFQIDSTPPEHYADVTGSGRYIDSLFRAQIGEAPRLGWFLGDKTFLTGEKHPRVYVLSGEPLVIEGEFQRVASNSEHRKITDTAKVACDDDGGLAFFDVVRAPTDDSRAFFLAAPLPQPYQVGVRRRASTEAEVAVARSILKVNQAAAYLDGALTVNGSEATYLLTAAYDTVNKEVLAGAIILQNGGTVIGFERSTPNDFGCADCAPPTLDDGLRRLYPVINGYTLRRFAYPVLLLNTSTNEGQARSLATFDPRGKYGEYRSYEFVVNCGRR